MDGEDAPPAIALTWSAECAEVFAAMAKAQSSLAPLKKGKTAEIKNKDKTKTLYSYAYTDLPSTLAACLAAYNEQGCTIIQAPRVYRNGCDITTLITHSSGQWIMSEPLFLPVSFTGAQDAGGGITYARRYALQAMTGLSPADDDDGGHAHANPPPASERARPTPNHRQKAPPPSRGYLDLEGARCTGQAAGLARGNRDRTKHLAKLHGAEIKDVWESVCTEAGIGPVLGPHEPLCPTTDQLLTEDAQRIRELLDAKIDACQVEREPGDDPDEQEPLVLDPPGAP